MEEVSGRGIGQRRPYFGLKGMGREGISKQEATWEQRAADLPINRLHRQWMGRERSSLIWWGWSVIA